MAIDRLIEKSLLEIKARAVVTNASPTDREITRMQLKAAAECATCDCEDLQSCTEENACSACAEYIQQLVTCGTYEKICTQISAKNARKWKRAKGK